LKTDVQYTMQEGVLVENIIGRLDGIESTDAILLSAHLDSVPNSPGATDDGSGVATVLETVRALRSDAPLRNTMIVLFTGPEENCCFGAKAFVSRHPWAKDVRLVVNVDAGGISGPSILAATAPDAGWLIEQAARVIPDPIGSSAIEALGSPSTDYTLMFRKTGWIGFDFNLSWEKRIHSGLDNIENLNPASIQHQGEHMLAVARYFGNQPLEIPKVPAPIYFDILGLTILYYPKSWAIFILLSVSLVFLGVLFLVLHRKNGSRKSGFPRENLTFRGIGFGALAFSVSLLTVPVLLAFVQLAIIQPLLSANMLLPAALTEDTLLSNSIRWVSMILTVVVTYFWYAFFKKNTRAGSCEFVLGAYLLLYCFSAGITLALPVLSYLFVWPLLAGLLAALLWLPSRMETTTDSGWLEFLAITVSGIIAVVFFIPGILIALISIDIRMIYLVPVFVVCFLGFLIPNLEYISPFPG
jgi:hypothetical protein